MAALPYVEMVAEMQHLMTKCPGSPISRGLPHRVPGASGALSRVHRARRVAAELADDPMVAATDPVVAAMAEAVQP